MPLLLLVNLTSLWSFSLEPNFEILFFFHLATAVGIPEVWMALLCLALLHVWTHPSPVRFFGSWQALTMNSTLTQLFLRLGLSRSDLKTLKRQRKHGWVSARVLTPGYECEMIAHLYPFVSICHLARCNNFIDDEGAIHLASALETGCAWTRHRAEIQARLG